MEQPITLRAEITITSEEQLQLQRYASVLDLIKQCFPLINTGEVADLAGLELRSLREACKDIEERRKRRLAPAKMIIDQANEDYQPALKANKAADEYLSGLLSSYWAEKMRAEREAQRKAREEAAAERARQEKEAAEARENAEQALKEAQRTARAAGPGEATTIELERAGAAVDALAQAQSELALAPLAIAPIEEAPKVAGIGFSSHWEAELTVSEEKAKEMIVIAALGFSAGDPFPRRELLAGLKLDMVYFNRLAVAQRSAFNVPGMRAVNKPVARRKR